MISGLVGVAGLDYHELARNVRITVHARVQLTTWMRVGSAIPGCLPSEHSKAPGTGAPCTVMVPNTLRLPYWLGSFPWISSGTSRMIALWLADTGFPEVPMVNVPCGRTWSVVTSKHPGPRGQLAVFSNFDTVAFRLAEIGPCIFCGMETESERGT